MPFDYKKEYKEFYLPKAVPQLVSLPPMQYLAVRGKGDPNEEGGVYQQAIGLLYGVAYTLKMCRKAGYEIDGYFDYVVPPLEGFWYQEGADGVDFAHKDAFCWISVIRVPDFVRRADFDWAVAEATRKKKQDFSAVEFLTVDEGFCVQMLHVGAYDDEPASVARMDAFLAENNCVNDFSAARMHHEIYLSDPRKTPPEKRKTVLRHPVRKL